MPEMTCPDCGETVADVYRNCPACGCPPEVLQRAANATAPRTTDGSVDERFSYDQRPQPDVPAEHPLFPVGPFKLAIMSLCTLQLYHVFWSYHQWERIRRATGEQISPALRAIFHPFWNIVLFRRIGTIIEEHDQPTDWSAVSMGLAYFLLQAVGLANPPVHALALLSFVPLVFVQQSIQQLHRAAPARESTNETFSGVNIFGVMVGGTFVLSFLLGTFFPEA